MALTATGIGSGLDIGNIVKVLVDAEKTPKEAMFNKTEDAIKAKVSAIGSLKSELAKFQDALKKLQSGDALNQRKVSTGDSQYVTVTADKSAKAGSYSIKVEQLAVSHKVAGTNVADRTLGVGEGTLDFGINGSSFSVPVLATDSLDEIAKKVNSASGNESVTATVITSDAGSRIVFSSDKSGEDNQITITANDTSGTGLSDMFGAGNLSTLQDAKNAIIYIDDQKVTSQSNEIKGAITGVTMNLTSADVSKTTTLKIEQDNDAVKDNVKAFVEAFNSLNASIDKMSAYDKDKKTASALQGDSMIRSIESQLRNMISERVTTDSGNVALYDIGIKTDKYGKLSIDETKLDKVINEDMSSVEQLFATKDTGLANRLDNLSNNYVKSDGLIAGRQNSYTSQQKRLDEQREAFSLKMEQLTARLTKQFNAMDLVVGQLNQQSSGLADRLNSLPGVVSK
ncbi:flagellar filament capping protein FliD [Shewanella baltica]|uniref:flagellar filament capping protein FliD n=1 Tax=Shewanella baltica TaxID=62322 RepID=UPI00014F8C0C|nr:flagellar filament capping protein FliD [Shewanella baltica]ABS09077.1 flagellar hook-associated 2 domain protein [Shewanella baltica OS185]EHC06364.1 flagellar hook-associated 2 domain-containing protein [Shewanella baltica OS625]KZK65138.1 flagellar hook protein FliD [Shewanella baltica]SUI48224.1 Flagellar cap protein [Shewanella baltica]